MSHFKVLVIGDNIDQQLQPYHEFECTGTNDEFVKDLDITGECREQFAGNTITRLRAPDGSLHSFFNDEGEWKQEFSQPDPDTLFKNMNRRTYSVPPGYEMVEVPSSQVQSLAEFVEGYYGIKPVLDDAQPDLDGEHKFGYCRVINGEVAQVIDRTNPNKKWDWWVVGGRWSGFIKLKPGADGAIGERGLMGSHFAKGEDRADQALKGAIDFNGMRDEAGDKAGALWDKANALTGGVTWESWESVRERMASIEAARDHYHAQPAIVALKKDAQTFGWDLDDSLAGKREDYVKAARDRALATYAVVYKGEWSARGDMGWFGFSDDKAQQGDWNSLMNDLIDGLPDDTMLTIVDCHI